MATTTDLITGSATLGVAENKSGQLVVFERRVDVGANSVSSDDIFQVISIPAGFHVIGAMFQIITAGTATVKFSLGTGADVDSLIVANLGDAAINTVYSGDGTKLTDENGLYFPAADTIDFVESVAKDILGVYIVRVWGFMSKITA